MSKFGQGLLFGSVIGGIVALLNAPKKGEETRQDLKLYLDQTRTDVDDVRFKVDNLKVAIERLSKEGLPQAQSAVKDLQTAIQHFSEESKPRINRVMNQVETLQTDIKDGMEDIQINK
ncbi:YtxH domain-containing protein [Vaginisenegalia massiliensis]|uniref:YtxH domain-containing protein n=1 Tax=Vaginisenegalia massiliensis TaxID=2058294 RepID=UPI000F52538F|nr:YtxH domain-containing protein [Vaginisenegalia massiliensis]